MQALESSIRIPIQSESGVSVDLELNTYFQDPGSYRLKRDGELSGVSATDAPAKTDRALEELADQILTEMENLLDQDACYQFDAIMEEAESNDEGKQEADVEELSLLFPLFALDKAQDNPTIQEARELISSKVRSLNEKLTGMIPSANPYSGERKGVLMALYPLVPSTTLWKAYKRRREADFKFFVDKVDRSMQIFRSFEIMRQMLSFDVRVITQSYPAGLDFKGISSLTSLLRELYLDTLATSMQLSVSMLVRHEEKPRDFMNVIQIVSNNTSILKPGQRIFLVEDQKQWQLRCASVVRESPGQIIVMYVDSPAEVTHKRVCYVPEVFVEWPNLLPLMYILVPMEKQGYYHVACIDSVRPEEITIYYRDGQKMERDVISKDLITRFALAPGFQGGSNVWCQIACYSVLLEGYVQHISTIGKDAGEEVIEADLRKRALASIFNSMGPSMLEEMEQRWRTVINYMSTLPGGEDTFITENDESGDPCIVYWSRFELQCLIESLLFVADTRVLGTIDILGPSVVAAIRSMLKLYFHYLTSTNHGIPRVTAALGSFLSLIQGSYVRQLGQRICSAYQQAGVFSRVSDLALYDEYFRAQCEIEAFQVALTDQVVRESLCLFRVSLFSNISQQDWLLHKPYFDNKRCTDGIRMLGLQLILATQSLHRFIGPFTKSSTSRYVLRKTLYDTVLNLSSIYMVITPSRARILQYKMDCIYLVGIILFFLMYTDPILMEDKSEDLQTQYHPAILNCCRRILARVVLCAGHWSQVTGFIQDAVKFVKQDQFHVDINVGYSLHKLLRVKKVDATTVDLSLTLTWMQRQPPEHFLDGMQNFFTGLKHEEIRDLEITWTTVLKPCPLTAKEVFELTSLRHELSSQTYPPLTEQQEEGIQPLKGVGIDSSSSSPRSQNLALFQASFIHE